jgi:CBS domain containing-hemolysin-like protein
VSAWELLGFMALTLVGLGLSSLFSGLETGIYTLNRVRLAVRAGQGDPVACRLRDEANHRPRLLGTLLVGNNLANYLGSFGIAAILSAQGLGDAAAIAINAGVLIPMLFVFGETLPKDLFRTHTDTWTYRWTPFLVGCRLLFTWTGLLLAVLWPMRVLGRVLGVDSERPAPARARVAQLLKEGLGAGVITEAQATLADRALAMHDLRVGQVMVPWRRAVTMHDRASRGRREAVIRRGHHSRLPLVDASGRVVGVVELLDCILELDRPLTELARKPVFLSRETTVRDAIQRLREARMPMGVVADARGGRPIGLVTLKNLVEPLTGRIEAW